MKAAKIPQVGARQWRWMYGGPNCWKSEPYKFLTSTGAPPVVLKGLVGKGWMWAEKREARIWMPRKQQWSGQLPGPEHWCGLTDKGMEVIGQIRDHVKAEYEMLHGTEGSPGETGS